MGRTRKVLCAERPRLYYWGQCGLTVHLPWSRPREPGRGVLGAPADARGPEHGKRIQGAHGGSADTHRPEHGKRGRGVHGASASILCTPRLELFTVPLELVLETRLFLTKAKTLL